MFDVSITNNYSGSVFFDDKNEIKNGGMTWTSKSGGISGQHSLEVPGMGHMMIFDLGDEKLHGFEEALSETWGVLMRYRGDDVYYRYEGGGKIDLTVDAHGCIQIDKLQGSFVQVNMEDLRAPGFDKAVEFHENGDDA